MTPLQVLAEFQELGQRASFHLADDTGEEWPQGYSLQAKAVKLFDAHPELQRDMRKIATDFLWSLTFFGLIVPIPICPNFWEGQKDETSFRNFMVHRHRATGNRCNLSDLGVI
jgi:hypothetical protein